MTSHQRWQLPTILVALLDCASATAAGADFPITYGQFYPTLLMLAGHPEVQKELRLEPGAIKQVRVLKDEFDRETLDGAFEAGKRAGIELGKILGRADLNAEEK